MTIIDGKAIAEQIKQEIAAEVAARIARGEKQPHLAAILVGHDGGSETYVANKVKACEVCGFKSTLIRYEDDITEETLLQKIGELNNDADVDGFIVQLPLPKHINEQHIIEAIDYRKDVDSNGKHYRCCHCILPEPVAHTVSSLYRLLDFRLAVERELRAIANLALKIETEAHAIGKLLADMETKTKARNELVVLPEQVVNHVVLLLRNATAAVANEEFCLVGV